MTALPVCAINATFTRLVKQALLTQAVCLPGCGRSAEEHGQAWPCLHTRHRGKERHHTNTFRRCASKGRAL